MKYTLIAILQSDGSFVSRDEETNELSVFTYPLLGQKWIQELDLQKLYFDYGFTEINKKFNSFSKMLAYVNKHIKLHRKSLGIPEKKVNDEDILQYLKYVPKVLLPMMIEQQEEYLKEGMYKAVKLMSKGLLNNIYILKHQKEVLRTYIILAENALKCHNNSCPFACTEESAYAQNTGCIPTPKDIINMRVKHGKTWACHDNILVPCVGALKYLEENNLPHEIIDRDFVSVFDDFNKYSE